VLSFINQVSNDPMVLADPEVFRSESTQFRPSQTPSDEQGENCPIAVASEVLRPFAQQNSGLIDGQPVANAYAETLCAFDTTDSRG
jgi:hypothetical protein